MGLNSLPVAFGPEVAKWITVATIDVTQIAVAIYLAAGRHENTYAAVLAALILPQVIASGPCLSGTLASITMHVQVCFMSAM